MSAPTGRTTAVAPQVDVIILTWNDGPLLDVATRSALASSASSAGAPTIAPTVTVHVVDNGSDPPAEVVDDERVVLHRNDRNRGVAGGRNQGIRAGRAPFVLLLDSDAELEPDTLAELLRPLLADPTLALSVPVYADQPLEAGAGRAPTWRIKLARGLNLRSDYDLPAGMGDGPWWAVDFGIGACQLFRRTAWEAVGGIDETYFYGPEDVDFCLRLVRAGWGVVQVGGAVCHHPARRRHRQILTVKGAAHAWAIARFLWRHRHFERLRGLDRR